MLDPDVHFLTENTLLRRYFAWLENMPKMIVLFIGLLCLTTTVYFDWFFGTEYNFTFFYIFPVAFTTWFAGRRSGIIIAVVSALTYAINTELFFDTAAIWNAASTFLMFSIVGIMVRIVRVMWEKEQLLSRHDNLTGLLNSRAFFDSLNYEIDRCKRSPAPFALAYIDLDSFKKVNDTYGHQRGDELLKLVANIMRSTLRATDLLSRIGGDEFAILFPNTDMEHIRVVEEKFRRVFLTVMKENHWPTTFSMGVVTFNSAPDNGDDAIKQADSAMYRAKNNGKNKTEFTEA